MKSYTTIDSYIKASPKEAQAKLRELHAFLQTLIGSGEETISYGIPTFKLEGNLVHFAGYKTHIGFYPGASGVIAFQKDLRVYECSKGTIRFPIDKPLPLPLIKKIVLYRIKENKAKAASKKTAK